VKISRDRMTWDANDETDVETILRTRDNHGGAEFWLFDGAYDFPRLTIRVTGDLSDIHYFPHDGHPGFRCLGGQDLPPRGTTLFVFDGCDPGYGEETPNEFVVPFATALMAGKDFFRDRQLPSCAQWFEL
jgi:hypothetical protein